MFGRYVVLDFYWCRSHLKFCTSNNIKIYGPDQIFSTVEIDKNAIKSSIALLGLDWFVVCFEIEAPCDLDMILTCDQEMTGNDALRNKLSMQ